MENLVYSSARNVYEEYEKASPSAYTRKSITGAVIGCNKCIGYCKYHGHPGFLTVDQRKKHNCIGKECFYYLAKPRREKGQKRTTDNLLSDILPAIQSTIVNEGVKIIRVTETGQNEVTAYFVTITNDYSFAESVIRIQESYGVAVSFSKLDYDFDTCVELLFRS